MSKKDEKRDEAEKFLGKSLSVEDLEKICGGTTATTDVGTIKSYNPDYEIPLNQKVSS